MIKVNVVCCVRNSTDMQLDYNYTSRWLDLERLESSGRASLMARKRESESSRLLKVESLAPTKLSSYLGEREPE